MKKGILFIGVILVIYLGFLTYRIEKISNNKQVIERKEINTTVTGFSTDLSAVFEKVDDKIVTIMVDDKIFNGAIYAINENKEVFIVTNYYSNADKAQIYLDNGDVFEGQKVLADSNLDLCFYKISPNYNVVPIASGSMTISKIGDWILSINNLSEHFASIGIISNKEQLIDIDYDGDDIMDYQIMSANVDLNHDEAGIIVNQNGELLGLKRKNSSQLLPIEEINLQYAQIKNNKGVQNLNLKAEMVNVSSLKTYQKSKMGINLDLTYGILVEEVYSGGMFDNFGIKPNDILLVANNMQLENLYYLRYAFANFDLGDSINIKVLRDQQEINLSVVIS